MTATSMPFAKILWAHTHARAKLDIPETDEPVMVRRARHLLNTSTERHKETHCIPSLMTIHHCYKAKRWSHNSQGFETISKMRNLYIPITSKSVKKQIKYSEYDGYQIQIFSLFFCRGYWREKIVKTLPFLHFWAFPYLLLLNIFSLSCFNSL